MNGVLNRISFVWYVGLVFFFVFQVENSLTCQVPDFVHSLAAQLCQVPQLQGYREHLLRNPELLQALEMNRCIADPHAALLEGLSRNYQLI